MEHKIFGVRIDDKSPDEILDLFETWIQGSQGHTIVTPNPEFLLRTRKNDHFRTLLSQFDLSVADGVGIRFAIAALTNAYLKNRHSGSDLIFILAQICAKHKKSLLLFGGSLGSAEVAAKYLQKQFPGLHVGAFDPGQIKGEGVDPAILKKLKEWKPAVIAVALGQEKQEKFIFSVLPHIPETRIAIGIGGALEMIAGKLPRAPWVLRKSGFEWAWRLFLEPKRFRRIMRATVIFPFIVACATLRQRRFFKACRRVFPEIIRQIQGL